MHEGRCLEKCPSGFIGKEGRCESCTAGCELCNTKECLTCKAGLFLFKKECIDTCPEKHYDFGHECLPCSEHCETCN